MINIQTNNGVIYRLETEDQLLRWMLLKTPAAVAAFLRTLQVVDTKAA